MFQYLRKAVTGNQIQNPHGNLIRDVYRKSNIKSFLANSIKQLQRLHIDNPDGVVERNDEAAENVCIGLEAVFLHELIDHGNYTGPTMNLKSMFSDGINALEDESSGLSFWEVIKEVTHSDVITQLKHLVVTTDIGLARAWIRLALNDSLIVSYLDAILADKSHLRKFYSPNAFLMDSELPDILKELLQGLLHFHFRLNYNSSKLNNWDEMALQLAGIIESDNSTLSIYESKPSNNQATERVRDLMKSRMENKTIEEDTNNDSSMTLSPPQAIITNTSYRSNINTGMSLESNTQSINQSISSASEPSPQMRSYPSSYNDEYRRKSSIIKQTPTVGNRLGGDGWSGWSSSFENTPASPEQNSTNPISPVIEEQSFNSILETYGNHGNEETVSPENTTDDVDGGITLPTDTTTETDEGNNIHSPTYNDSSLKQMDFEVVPRDISSSAMVVDEKTQTSFEQLSIIAWEIGLDKQSFRCYQCSKPIGLIYGPYKICYFNGGYYCNDCHDDEEYFIPAQVLHNWNFQKYKVSKYNKVFLMKIEEEPLFHMDEINPVLYDVIPILKEVKVLRIQLQYIKEYIITCRQEVADDFRMRLWPREYLSDDIHQFSLLDLVQVQKGQLSHHLQKIINLFTKHIYKCNLCREKGFICEFCQDEKIIYPFELSTAIQCRSCLSVFHKKCRKDKRCPKCVRIQLRIQNTSKDLDFRLSVTQKEHLVSSDIL